MYFIEIVFQYIRHPSLEFSISCQERRMSSQLYKFCPWMKYCVKLQYQFLHQKQALDMFCNWFLKIDAAKYRVKYLPLNDVVFTDNLAAFSGNSL